jgi:hypothetical protein
MLLSTCFDLVCWPCSGTAWPYMRLCLACMGTKRGAAATANNATHYPSSQPPTDRPRHRLFAFQKFSAQLYQCVATHTTHLHKVQHGDDDTCQAPVCPLNQRAGRECLSPGHALSRNAGHPSRRGCRSAREKRVSESSPTEFTLITLIRLIRLISCIACVEPRAASCCCFGSEVNGSARTTGFVLRIGFGVPHRLRTESHGMQQAPRVLPATSCVEMQSSERVCVGVCVRAFCQRVLCGCLSAVMHVVSHKTA